MDFRNITDTTPTADPILSLDQFNYNRGDTVAVTVTDTIPNVDLEGIDFAIAKIGGSSLTLTETGDDTDTFTGSFTLGNSFPTIQYSRSFSSGPSIETSSDASSEDTLAHLARSSVDLDISNPGDVKVSDHVFNSTNSSPGNLCFTPVIHAIDVQLLEGATLGTSSSIVALSFANADLGGVDPSLLQMWYQHEGEGTWRKISPTFIEDFSLLHPDGPWATDFDAKTITSNTDGLESISNSFTDQITFGKFTLGSDTGCSGGGGGGLVRPSLVVNALAGIGGGAGGGSAYSAPQLQLGNLVLLDWIDVPLEVEKIVLNHDSSTPASPYDLGFFEDFDYPMIINDKGFILSGFTTTLETQTLKTNTPHTIKFILYESEIIQHFSLYTNLRDATDEIRESDTQILYNANQELQVVDPNGFFESVSLTVNELEDNKKQIVLEITFANTMDTSHIIVRSWDPNLFSGDNYILNAWEIVSDEIVESPITTYEEPVIEELQSTGIPKWIKNNAAWWSEQQISDSDFVSGIEYLIKNEIINVAGVEVGTDSSTTEIPDWIKNNAGWWADSLITDGDFTEAMQWLVSNGVIQL